MAMPPRLHADRVDSRSGAAGRHHVARRAGDGELHPRSRVGFRGAAAVRADARRITERKYSMKTSKASLLAGFTLVEIMIVVAIIGILAAIGIPSFVKARARSQATEIGR